jgi:hypothetical protein
MGKCEISHDIFQLHIESMIMNYCVLWGKGFLLSTANYRLLKEIHF